MIADSDVSEQSKQLYNLPGKLRRIFERDLVSPINSRKRAEKMFIGFSVSNYLSFKTAQTISMAASKVVRHKEHILNGNGKKILKTGLIYGANASGKSNLVKAIDFSRDIILDGLSEADLNKKYFRICGEGYK